MKNKKTMAKFFYKFYIGDSRMSAEKFLPSLKHFFNAVCFYIKRGKYQSQERLSRETLLSESLPKAVLGDGTVTSSPPAWLPLMISAGQPGDLRQTNRKETREFFPPQSLPARGGTSALPAGSYLYTGSQTGYPDEKYGHNYFICFHRSPAMDEKTKPEEDLALLKEKLTRLMPAPTRFEAAIPGMMLSRFDRDTPASKSFYFPIAALIVQGYKRSMIGNQEVNYGEGYCMVVGVDMPGVYQISSVTPEKPFLSISIRLDRRIISQLITEMPSLISSDTAEQEPAVVARAGAELLEAFVRLVDLLDDPGRISVFAPMILREIHYHLLSGSQGGCLRFFSSTGTQAGQVARAVSWLRENFARPFHIEELARQTNMAPSTFHRHFRQVTGMSPLQFQKRLRLYEAERLMLVEGKDASSAAIEVGYESVSQFNREYKRQFGAPPRRDVEQKTRGIQ